MKTIFWLKIAAVLSLCTLLTSCGPGSQDQNNTQQTRVAASVTNIAVSSINVTSLTKVSETRVGRDVYDYVFRLTVKNSSAQNQTGITATLTTAGNGATILDGTAFVGAIGAGMSLTTTDTISIRQNRTQPFSLAALVWQFTADSSVPGILLPGDPAKLATTALKDYAATLSQADLDIDGAPSSDALFYKNELNAVIKPTASIGQVNAALSVVSGRVVAMWDNDPVLTIQVPDPGSFNNLEQIAAALEQSGAFVAVTRRFQVPSATLG